MGKLLVMNGFHNFFSRMLVKLGMLMSLTEQIKTMCSSFVEWDTCNKVGGDICASNDFLFILRLLYCEMDQTNLTSRSTTLGVFKDCTRRKLDYTFLVT